MSAVEPSGVVWRTSSYTNANGACVEVGVDWRTSSYTSGNNECVEVGTSPFAILVRDTKQRNGGSLRIDSRPWRAFLTEVRAVPIAR
ncbi:DUF397 domain-containing protein [Amycolatopsis minnesotensis]|uniref:DUF397 domain-containing protein n=1 Tax=Amycolatopsis minnesotensis TaxID=337894 RepID=A0ABP5EAZ0_9PSEU